MSDEKSKLDSVKREVNDVTIIMKNNMNAIINRDNALNDLDVKSHILDETAYKFNNVAVKLKRKMWWQNTKYILMLLVIISILILIISLSIYGTTKK